MSGNMKKVIAFNYFGGKFSWLDNLYEFFPNDLTHLAEVFGGSMAVSLNYQKKAIITVNEINGEITNFFEVLRTRPEELLALLYLTPCSQEEFNRCWNLTDDKVENARRFYVRIRQSFFGLGAQRKSKGWHMAKQHLNAHRGETVSKWNNALDKLVDVIEVLRTNIQITNNDFRDFIKKTDTKNTFFYEDPPYVQETRASFNDYRFEFNTNDHIDLADINHKVAGKVMISGYRSKLYDDELYKDWQRIDFPSKKNNIRSGLVTESIWINYEIKEPHTLFN